MEDRAFADLFSLAGTVADLCRHNRLLSLYGKSLRPSFTQGWDKSGMAHMVSVFMSKNRLVLAQTNTSGKGHELEAIRQLLHTVDIQDAVVTIDTLGGPHNVAAAIVEKKTDYVLSLKGNQFTLGESRGVISHPRPSYAHPTHALAEPPACRR